jgi:hypothetical protein
MESCYVGPWSRTNNKNKEDKRMSNDLDTNNNLSDIATGFQNDWPLSNSDVKLTKKQQDNVKALKNFFTKMDEDVGKWNQFLKRIWSNKAKMPLLYAEKNVTWEAQIYNAFDEAGIDIGMWLVDMANNRKGFGMREKK